MRAIYLCVSVSVSVRVCVYGDDEAFKIDFGEYVLVPPENFLNTEKKTTNYQWLYCRKNVRTAEMNTKLPWKYERKNWCP